MTTKEKKIKEILEKNGFPENIIYIKILEEAYTAGALEGYARGTS